MTTYLYDKSLEGLLTAVFEWFERKPGQVVLQDISCHQPNAFEQAFEVYTDRKKADRVWAALLKKVDKGWIRRIYCAYLSELPETQDQLFQLICYLFQNPAGAENNFGNAQVLHVSQMAKKVEREKHRMEAFIRFQETSSGMFYCGIDPDFNVLPLISKHFKNRYADQQWLIYDLKRKYGLFYDLNTLEQVEMEFTTEALKTNANATIVSPKEELYALLWKDYFKSTNIPARKNTKLHIQHVPRRYWKYLTEKQPD
jgi:probable DNA metabolism protein